MSKLSTKDIPTGGTGGGVPKSIQPGNHTAKINKISVEKGYKDDMLHVVMNLETTPMGDDFEGFFIDKDNESLGRHLGQVGRVKASDWAFADSTTKGGVAISRDREMLRFLANLCAALDCTKWLDAQDDKHDTIQSLYDQFEKDKPYAGKFLNWCIAGKEYKGKQNNYINFDLYLPKFTKTAAPFESVDVPEKDSKLIKFSVSDHIKKLKDEGGSTVTEFGTQNAEIPTAPAGGHDFDI